MASGINVVALIGNITRNAELRYTSGGLAICSFGIAVNRSRKKEDAWVDEPNFFDITLMGRRAEALQKYLLKGKQVAINGELRQERWEKDGQPRSRVSIIALNIQLLGGSPSSKTTPDHSPSHEPKRDSDDGELPNASFEDDIPF